MDKNNMSFGMKIVIVIFAVILVLSLMLPFFSSCGNTATQDSTTQDSSDTSLTTVEGVDEVYQAKIDELQAKLAADSTSLLNTVNMGNTYMEWAEALGQIDTSTLTSSSTASASAADALSLIAGSSSADSAADASEDLDGVTSTAADESASTDTDDTDAASDAVAELQQRIRDTYAAAIPYYDQYLAQENSKSVTVNRAMCKYYSGDEEGAIADLEAFVSEDGTFSPAWYSLGQLYESQGRLSDASDAFTAALSADQDESYNLSIYASYQLSMISAYQDALASASAETSEASDVSVSIDEASSAIEAESLSSDGETGASDTQGEE